MKMLKPSVAWEHGPTYKEALRIVEKAARTCYRSFDRSGPETAEPLIRHCINMGHESVLEHVSFGLRIVTDRGVMAELTRHRIGIAFSIESTRYCRYNGDIEFITPWWYEGKDSAFEKACTVAEESYKALLKNGLSPQGARAVLPLCLKTEIVVTANLREWRHIFHLRRSPAAHPDMRRVMDAAFWMAKTEYPVFFEDTVTEELWEKVILKG